MTQPTLFDTMACYSKQVRNQYSVRTVIGEVAEEYATAVLGVTRSRINGAKALCEDFTTRHGGRGEIKAVRGQALVYKWRLEREVAVPSYAYVFVCHDCAIAQVRRGDDVLQNFIQTPPSLVIATVLDVQQTVGQRRLRNNPIHNPKTGFTRKKYAEGFWQFPPTLLPLIWGGMIQGVFASQPVLVLIKATQLGMVWLKQNQIKVYGQD